MHEAPTIAPKENTAAKAAVSSVEPAAKLHSPGAFTVMPSLMVGSPDDPLEHEAEGMADRVMRMRSPGATPPEAPGNTIRRQASAASGGDGMPVNSATTRAIQQQKGGGSRLDAGTQTFMESRFGADFSGVNIHTNTHAAGLSDQLQANAFTTGTDIFFNQNQYSPGSSDGMHLLAHELTHVVQQQSFLQRQMIQRIPRPTGTSAPTSLSSYAEAMRQGIVYNTDNFPFNPTPHFQQGIVETVRTGYDVDYVFTGTIATWLQPPLRSMARAIFHLMENETDPVITNNLFIVPMDLSGRHQNNDASLPAGPNTRYRFTCTRFDATTAGRGRATTTTQNLQIIIEDVGSAPVIPNAAETASQRISRFQRDYGFTRTDDIIFGDAAYDRVLQAMSLVPNHLLLAVRDIPFNRIIGSARGANGEVAEYVSNRSAANVVSREIRIYDDALATGTTPQTLAFTMVHELGHALAFRPTEGAARGGTNLINETGTGSFREAAGLDGGLTKAITVYGRTGWGEYFAETFSMFINEPATLLVLRPHVHAYFLARFPSPAPPPATAAPPVVTPTTNPDAGVIQRDVVDSAARYLNFRQLLAKKVTQFKTHIQAQTDWYATPAISEDQRESIEYIILFLTDEVEAVFASKTISQLHTLFDTDGALADERQNRLKAYAAAVSARKFPFEISDFATSLTQAVNVGRDIKLLQTAFPDYVLHTAMKEAQFTELRDAGFLNDLIAYYTTAVQQPMFQADNGSDFHSFFLFRRSGVSPLHYDSTNLANHVRNYHRFEKTALDRLMINFGNSGKTKPLTLILHTSLDHNGAFHRDPNLTAVITNNAMLTLMIEGFGTLGEVQAQIAPLANTYGVNNRINQLMFAGHGNARSIELAGTTSEEITPEGEHRIQENDQGLNLDTNQQGTNDLIDEVLRFMDNDTTLPADRQRNSRVVFNACLTNSNAVGEAINDGNMPAAQAHVSTYIRDHASLATFLDQYAATQGAGLLTSIGSNASFGQVSLLGGGNTLDILSAGDPAITSTKIDYVERGTEPEGAVRAVLESWAANQVNTIAAMNRRLVRREANSWDILLIRGAYRKIIASFSTDAEKIREIAICMGSLSELKTVNNCLKTVGWRIGAGNLAANAITDDFYADLLTAVSPASEFTSNQRIKATILQLWCMKDAGKDAGLMTVFENNTVNFLIQFADIDYLDNNNAVLARLFTAGSAAAKLRLALHGMMTDPANAQSSAHLMTVLAGATSFPAAMGVNRALGGATTESHILEQLGVNAAAPVPPVGGGAAPPTPDRAANVRLHGQADNTVYVNPIHQYSHFTGYLVKILRERPDSSSRFVGDVSDQADFYVLGDTAEWYAVQHTYEGETVPSVAFLHKRTGPHSYITNLNP